jgi:hypothetical protein
MTEILDKKPGVTWEDIAGLDFAKRSVMEVSLAANDLTLVCK